MLFYKRKKRVGKSDNSWQIYKQQALTLISNIIQDLDLEDGFQFNRVCVRNQKTRWGSCSSKNNLNFNYKIIYLPLHLQKYLVVHELCHLKHMNHSKDYWKAVSYFIPEYKEYSKELRKINPIKLEARHSPLK